MAPAQGWHAQIEKCKQFLMRTETCACAQSARSVDTQIWFAFSTIQLQSDWGEDYIRKRSDFKFCLSARSKKSKIVYLACVYCIHIMICVYTLCYVSFLRGNQSNKASGTLYFNSIFIVRLKKDDTNKHRNHKKAFHYLASIAPESDLKRTEHAEYLDFAAPAQIHIQ